VPFLADAYDADGIQKVRFWAGATYLGYDTLAPYGKTWATQTLGNGRYTLKVQMIDLLGNSLWSSVAVTLINPDVTAPTVSITSPSAGATVSGTIMIQATAADTQGLQKVRFYVDGVYLGYDTTAPYSKPWDSTTLPDGAHTIKAQAVDWANNSTWHEHPVQSSNP
jgi:hypothetical protein